MSLTPHHEASVTSAEADTPLPGLEAAAPALAPDPDWIVVNGRRRRTWVFRPYCCLTCWLKGTVVAKPYTRKRDFEQLARADHFERNPKCSSPRVQIVGRRRSSTHAKPDATA